MALKLQVVATAAAGMSIDDVPADVQSELETAYTEYAGRDNMEIKADFDSREDALTFIRQARAWAAGRKNGELNFRKLPRKGEADTRVTFKLTRVLANSQGNTENGNVPAPDSSTEGTEVPVPTPSPVGRRRGGN